MTQRISKREEAARVAYNRAAVALASATEHADAKVKELFRALVRREEATTQYDKAAKRYVAFDR